MWENEKGKESQPVGKVEEKEEEVKLIEAKVEEVESSNGKVKKEEIITSVW